MDPESITNAAYRAAIDERITELLSYRRWYRANRWADWPALRRDNDVELRALVKLARSARDLARPAIERADAVTASLAEVSASLAAGEWYAGMSR